MAAPDEVTAGMPRCVTEDGEMVLSVLCAGATPETFMLIDGMPLASTVISPALVRAALPSVISAHPRKKSVILLNRVGASAPAELVVRAGAALDEQRIAPSILSGSTSC